MKREINKKILEDEIKMLVSGITNFSPTKAGEAKSVWADAVKIMMLKSSLEN